MKDLLYRGKRLVNWDPVLLTAVSDLEVISKEESGYLWHIKYQVADSEEILVVATTRPETMLGDSAVLFIQMMSAISTWLESLSTCLFQIERFQLLLMIMLIWNLALAASK